MMNTSDSSSPSSCCSGSPSCTAALVLGIIALVLALIGFFPCLGWITLIPAGLLAIIALIMSIVAVSKGSPKGALVVAIIALALSAVAGIVQAWMASATVTYMEQHQDYGKEGSGNSKGASADGAGKQGVIEAVRGGGWNVPCGWNRLPGFVVPEPF